MSTGSADGNISSTPRDRVVLIPSHDEAREVSHCQPHGIWVWRKAEKGWEESKDVIEDHRSGTGKLFKLTLILST